MSAFAIYMYLRMLGLYDVSIFLGVQNTFSIITPYKGYIVQSLEEKDVFDWLYALNPLLAGQIKSQLGNKRRNNPTS